MRENLNVDLSDNIFPLFSTFFNHNLESSALL